MKAKIPPPVWLLVAGGAMWLLAHSDWALPFSIPFQAPVAVLLAAIGIGIDVMSLRRFLAAQTTVNPLRPETASALVRDGLFGISRNPMYLGLLLVLTGWGIWLGSASNVAVLFLFVVTMNALQIKPEESALRTLFGQDYDDYCSKVRRWI